MSSTSQSGYADLREVKRRLNIPDLTTSSDLKVADQMQEADNYVNVQIGLHAIVPISVPDPELVSLASSLAASLFNYWQTPIKDRNLDAIKSWKQSIQDHILATFGRKNPNLLTGGDTFGKTTGVTGFDSGVRTNG